MTEAAIDWCEAQGAERLLLYIDTPALYTRYGFATVPEHRFTGPAPRPEGRADARRLSLDAHGDVALLRSLLERRAPVSERFGLLGHGSMVMFNLLARPAFAVHWLEAHGIAVVTARREDGTLRLIDVIGPRIPRLATVLGALDATPERIEVSFPTDLLAWDGTPDVRPGGALMARGAADLPSQLGFPETASF